MLVKAVRSFAGTSISMGFGEERDLKADEAKRLIRAGHVVKFEKAATAAELPGEKEVAENEIKSGDAE